MQRSLFGNLQDHYFFCAYFKKLLRRHSMIAILVSGVFLIIYGIYMTKEIIKHRKDERKQPKLSPKERKAQKREKKQGKKI